MIFEFGNVLVHGLKAANRPSHPVTQHYCGSILCLIHMFFCMQVYVQVNKEAEHNEDLKQSARDFFRQLEQRESQAVSLWQQFREITVNEYQHVYKVQPVIQCSKWTLWSKLKKNKIKTWCKKWKYKWNFNVSLTEIRLNFLPAVRGALWYLLWGVLSPRPSPGGGAAAAEPRPA